MTRTGWADVAVALAAITLGWVGHHANRKKLPKSATEREDSRPFTTARFPQFVIEILIIVVYFALVRIADLPSSAGASSSSELGKARWLTIAFFLYLSWDLFDVYIATTPAAGHDPERKWAKRALSGMSVTVVFMLSFLSLWYLAWTEGLGMSVFAFDALVILLLVCYRVVQEIACQGARKVLRDRDH